MKVSMLVRPLVFVTFTAPLLAGCGGGGSGSPTAAPRSVSATLPDGLTGTLTEDRAAVPAGGAVTYTVALTNGTKQPVTYLPVCYSSAFSTGLGAVIGAVVNEYRGEGDGDPLGGTGSGLVSVGPAVTLAAGQSVSATINGGAFQPPGPYHAEAEFTVEVSTGLPAPNRDTYVSATTGPLALTAQ